MKKSSCLAGALALGLILPAAGLGASLIAASAANAQQTVGSGQTGGSVAFVRDTGNAGQFEVQSSRLASSGPSMSACAAMPARRSRTRTK